MSEDDCLTYTPALIEVVLERLATGTDEVPDVDTFADVQRAVSWLADKYPRHFPAIQLLILGYNVYEIAELANLSVTDTQARLNALLLLMANYLNGTFPLDN